jgi:hypothetical protein
MRHRALIAATSFVIIAGGLFAVPIIQAAPSAPHVLYGQVRTQDGTVLGSGYSIEARINNVHYGQTVSPTVSMDTQTHDTVSGYNYGSLVNFQ